MNFKNLLINSASSIKKLLGIGLLTFCISNVTKGQTGQALQFNGINNYISLPVIPLSGDYTKEAWINTNSLTSFPNILTGNSSTGTALFLNNGQLAAGHGPSFNQVVDPTPLVAGTWYHVAVTYNASSGVMNLYKNGVLVATNPAVPAYTETQMEIGRFTGSYYFDGSIDEVRIWNVERSPAQIAAFKDCPLNGSEAGLLAYYNFNEGIAGGTNTGITTLNDLHGGCPLNGQLENFSLTGTTSNWIAPGGTSTTCTTQVPNISVAGNLNCIALGDATPSITDNTDFGSTSVTTNTDETFVIHNNGGAALNIAAVALTGPDASSYSILSAPSLVVLPGDSTTVVIRFSPTTTGIKDATVTITSDDLDETLYSYAITGNATSLVPVSLLYFNATPVNKTAKLFWETATELNNSGFNVLRSIDGGVSWQKIGFVKATNLQTGSTYSFIDPSPVKGVNAYRISQVDFNGNLSNSNSALVNFSDLPIAVTIFPNPVKDKLTLVFNDVKLLNSKATIVSASGSVITSLVLNNFNQPVDMSRFADGLYFIKLSNGTTIRFVKQ